MVSEDRQWRRWDDFSAGWHGDRAQEFLSKILERFEHLFADGGFGKEWRWLHNFTGPMQQDPIRGTDAGETLNGSSESERIYGEGGADSISGGGGNDRLSGGSGNDSINGDEGNDYIRGGEGDDSIAGGAGNDCLSGGHGNDLLNGAGGDDWLNGGEGADALNGGAGDDRYYVDDPGDAIIEAGNEGFDTVYSWLSLTLGANLESLALKGSSAIDGTGNSGDNLLIGNLASNVLGGLDGNDTLEGGGGNDVLLGGAANDSLAGGRGDDRLTGGLGTDEMFGGRGVDRFIFTAIEDSAAGSGRDWIGDFSVGRDLIDVSQIDASSTSDGNQAFVYIGGSAFSNVAGELRYDPFTDRVSGDTNGDGIADFEIEVQSSQNLLAGDFIL